jgi:hypothetical protein
MALDAHTISVKEVDNLIRRTSSNLDTRGFFGNPSSSNANVKRSTRAWEFNMSSFCDSNGAEGNLFVIICDALAQNMEWLALLELKTVCRDMQDLIDPIWFKQMVDMDNAQNVFAYARRNTCYVIQIGVSLQKPENESTSHMTSYEVERWNQHYQAKTTLLQMEETCKRIFINKAAEVFGHLIAEHMCKFFENKKGTLYFDFRNVSQCRELPFLQNGKVNHSFAYHTLIGKCQVHYFLGEPCRHSVRETTQPLFSCLPGNKLVLHCKAGCVKTQCVDTHLDPYSKHAFCQDVRNAEKFAKVKLAKQLLAMRGVPTPFERNRVLSALGIHGDSTSFPKLLWIVDHPAIPDGFSIQSMAKLSKYDVKIARDLIALGEKAAADRAAADRKVHTDAMMAELDSAIKFSELPYDSIFKVGETFHSVPTLLSRAVHAVHDSPPKGWSGSILETERVIPLLQLLNRMHVLREVCMENVPEFDGVACSPVSPEALAWVSDLWGGDLPDSGGRLPNYSLWRSAVTRPKFDETCIMEEEKKSFPTFRRAVCRPASRVQHACTRTRAHARTPARPHLWSSTHHAPRTTHHPPRTPSAHVCRITSAPFMCSTVR